MYNYGYRHPKKILDQKFLEKLQLNTLANPDASKFKENLNDILSEEELIDVCADLSEMLDRIHQMKHSDFIGLKKNHVFFRKTSKKLMKFFKTLDFRTKTAQYYTVAFKDLLEGGR